MVKIFSAISLIAGLSFFASTPVEAQSFMQQTESGKDVAAETKTKAPKTSAADNDLKMTPEEEREITKRLKEKLNPQIKDGNLVLNPVNLEKTADGSPRGTVAFFSTGENAEEDDSLIFLYYSDFKITRSSSIGLGCRVRFHILNGMNSRLSNLSVKLVWPNISTSVSFNDVNPNNENYFDYVLFGDGCYSMDKIPNIVVNRCRVKGLTQSACAGKIRWLTKRK